MAACLHALGVSVWGTMFAFDALVTSANLTHAGLLENLEMGLRIQGPMAVSVVSHFDLLIAEGVLERQP